MGIRGDSVSESVGFSIAGRSKEVALTRLRFGVEWLNEVKYLLRKVDSPNCSVCLVNETVEHFLLDCVRTFSLSLDLSLCLRNKNELVDICAVLKDGDCLNIIWQYFCQNNITFRD